MTSTTCVQNKEIEYTQVQVAEAVTVVVLAVLLKSFIASCTLNEKVNFQ